MCKFFIFKRYFNENKSQISVDLFNVSNIKILKRIINMKNFKNYEELFLNIKTLKMYLFLCKCMINSPFSIISL